MIYMIFSLSLLFALSIGIWAGVTNFATFLFVAFLLLLIPTIKRILQECHEFGVRRVFHFQSEETSNIMVKVLIQSLKNYRKNEILEVSKETVVVRNDKGTFCLYCYSTTGKIWEHNHHWFRKRKNKIEPVENANEKVEKIKQTLEEKLHCDIVAAILIQAETDLSVETKFPILPYQNGASFVLKAKLEHTKK